MRPIRAKYTYDADSNRLTTTGAVPSAETIAATSNQLASTTGSIARTYSYDAAGNTLGYGSNSYTFNQRGRMSQATVSGSYTNYVYNALGQLIQKSATGGTTLLVYDEAGHILGEYTGTGGLVQETIWMGDTPIATLQPNGTGISIYYVHTDHLGTPRKITRPSGNGLMWRWDPDTFGSLPPNSNPAGLGTFNYNLRFPGQYALNESGLYYNYFRTYDPQMGRYIESDPMGLGAGVNTYAYASGNPLGHIDPLGLDDSICLYNFVMCNNTPPMQSIPNLPVATKSKVCAFLGSNYADYDAQKAWFLANRYRKAEGWGNSLTNREVENWLSIQGWPWGLQSWIPTILTHETLFKFPPFNSVAPTTAFNLEALKVGLDGRQNAFMSPSELKEYCSCNP